jgi:hypothetical protein
VDKSLKLDLFSNGDLEVLSALVAVVWRSASNRDWSTTAGTLEWTCTKTADHAVDTVVAPAIFLASRKQDGYPELGWKTPWPDARPEQLVEGLEIATRVLVAVIDGAPPGTRAVIRRRPEIQTAGPEDFAPRAGLELILHAHDVCSGLAVEFEPPADICYRLREHTRDWPAWGLSQPTWTALPTTDDPWGDLLHASGRQRQQRGRW